MEQFNYLLSNIGFTLDYFKYWVVSVILWTLLYLVIHFFVKVKSKSKKDENDTKNRIVSIIHGVFCIYVGLTDTFVNKAEIFGVSNSEFQNYMMLISKAYFFYDTIACIIFGISNLPMLLHHLFCILGFYSSIFYNISGTEIIKAMLATEITNPVMHMREIFKNSNMGKTKIYLLFELTYMSLYILARPGWGTYLMYLTFSCSTSLVLVKMSALFLFFQSVFFSYKMIGVFKFRFTEYQERKKNKICLWWFENNKQIDDMEIYKKKKEKVNIP